MGWLARLRSEEKELEVEVPALAVRVGVLSYRVGVVVLSVGDYLAVPSSGCVVVEPVLSAVERDDVVRDSHRVCCELHLETPVPKAPIN